MSKYDLVVREYNTYSGEYTDKVVKLSGIEDMNDLSKIDNFLTNHTEKEIIEKIFEENNVRSSNLKIRYYVDEQARYFNPVYDNDVLYYCSLFPTTINHSNKKRINDNQKFNEEKKKLVTLINAEKEDAIREINNIFPYDSQFKNMLVNYVNDKKGKENEIDYQAQIVMEFENYTTFRSWIVGNNNKNRVIKKNNVTMNTPVYQPINNDDYESKYDKTETEKLQNLNAMFTEEDNEEFLDEEEMKKAGYDR